MIRWPNFVLIKVVKSWGGPTTIDACKKKKAMVFGKKNEWNPQFVATWDDKEVSTHAAFRGTMNARNARDRWSTERWSDHHYWKRRWGQRRCWRKRRCCQFGDCDEADDIVGKGKWIKRNYCCGPAPSRQLIVLRRCMWWRLLEGKGFSVQENAGKNYLFDYHFEDTTCISQIVWPIVVFEKPPESGRSDIASTDHVVPRAPRTGWGIQRSREWGGDGNCHF